MRGIRTPDALTYPDYKSGPIDHYGTTAFWFSMIPFTNGLWKSNSLKGEGSRIRTYSGVANRFTVCPSSPTLAYPHLNSCRESLDGFCFSLTIYSLWWGRWDSNSRASVLQTVPIALMSAPNTEWHVFFKIKVWMFVICCNHSLMLWN